MRILGTSRLSGDGVELLSRYNEAADALTERDEKPRLANQLVEENELFEFEDRPNDEDPMFFDFQRDREPVEPDSFFDSQPYIKPL
jgi:hypothetical protein